MIATTALRALLDDHEERYGRGDLWRAASEEMAKVEALGWIAVSDKPIPTDMEVLVLNDRGAFCVGWGTDDDLDWWSVPDGKYNDRPLRGSAPTHWMKIPEKKEKS